VSSLRGDLLKIKNVSKSFSDNQVLKNINFEVKKGEIHALIGENGAGKSTLMNILFGMPVIHSTGGYEGSIEINGKPTKIMSAYDAMNNGIGMVHQEFMLIPAFTITENIKINREITQPTVISKILSKRLEDLDYNAMNADARKALDTLDMGIEEYVRVGGLSVGHMQFIEIAREIDKTGVQILVFDEPTAVLTETETVHLLNAIRRLAAKGIGIIFISHRLDEIISVADRVTVLRDGEHVATKHVKDTNVMEIAELMIGRALNTVRPIPQKREISDDVVLSIRDLVVMMPGEEVKNVGLEVKRGEIVGIGGLAGQGKLGIANGLMGVYPATGKVVFNGRQMPLNNAKEAINSGIGFLSEDRKGVGLLLDGSIELNTVFTAMQNKNDFLIDLGIVKYQQDRKIREHTKKMIRDLDIRCTSSSQLVGSLSGGNQQKVCVARVLTQDPSLLLVSEPTRGIDIGAKKLILDLLLKLNQEQGMTIVMTSSELAELRSICDKIYIVCEGKIAGMLLPDASDAAFGLMMSGSRTVEDKEGVS
jgi:simple sugar transport system ATP-binding protein